MPNLFSDCSIVIEALKGVEPERRCFRMIGGVLVERTVKDVLPALENNKDQVRKSTGHCYTKLIMSLQYSYRSWKTWKVMEFKNLISRPEKSCNLFVGP